MDLFHINVKRNNFHWVSRSSFPYWWGHSFSTKKSTMFYPETKPRHTLEHDPPFTVDIGLNIHGLTRKKASNSSVTPAGNLHFLRLCLRAWWVDWQISMRIFWWSRRESYLLPVCIEVCLPLILSFIRPPGQLYQYNYITKIFPLYWHVISNFQLQ